MVGTTVSFCTHILCGLQSKLHSYNDIRAHLLHSIPSCSLRGMKWHHHFHTNVKGITFQEKMIIFKDIGGCVHPCKSRGSEGRAWSSVACLRQEDRSDEAKDTQMSA